MDKIAIVVVGYNRTKELLRLLDSLNAATYEEEQIPLIISLDNSGDDSVLNVAENFCWLHGKKVIRRMEERVGLRRHILSCGQYLNEFDAIVVLEDDLIVASDFFRYTKQAVNFYKDNDRVAGISLYSHLWNVNVSYPFIPCKTQYDNYFLQFAQSWGQIWLKKQWNDFMAWYENHCEEFGKIVGIPDFICRWNHNSWLKYHIRYCIETDKYFVYPYESLATCFSEAGEHALYRTTTYQVPLFMGNKDNYRFASMIQDAVMYDAYFERVINHDLAGIEAEDICFDLYGTKETELFKRYIVSTRLLPYQVVDTYALDIRPQELNVLMKISGEDIFLYDTTKCAKAKKGRQRQDIKLWKYHNKALVKKKIVLWAILEYCFIKVKLKMKKVKIKT